MKMTQPFPGVWLPASIDMDFGFTTALGAGRGPLRRASIATTGSPK